MVDWIIYYGDGSTHSSADGPPEDAPRENVQVVVTKGEKVGKLPWHSEEFYCWKDGTWIPHDQRGIWKYLADEKWPIVLQSYAIHPSRFQAIYDQAVGDTRISWIKPEPNL